MLTKKDILKLECLAKRHRQLQKLKYLSEAERCEIQVLDRFFRSLEQRVGDIDKKFSKLEAMLLKHDIRLTDTGVENLH